VKQVQEDDESQPRVTIALPVYNGAVTLAVAVRSIVMQTFADWELIILNDASTDESLAKQLSYLQQHPDIDLLATATIPFCGDGAALGCLPVTTTHEQICARPWNGFHLPHPTWMGKTAWFRQHRYDSSADGAEDQYLLLRSYQTSRFACLSEPLLAYREADHPIKKKLRARRIVARTFIPWLLFNGKWLMAIRAAGLYLLKSGADILHMFLGLSCLRSNLLPLNKVEQAKWKKLWTEIHVISTTDSF